MVLMVVEVVEAFVYSILVVFYLHQVNLVVREQLMVVQEQLGLEQQVLLVLEYILGWWVHNLVVVLNLVIPNFLLLD